MTELSIREAYGKALAVYGEVNSNVIVLDADTSASTYSNLFRARFPERFINAGIAEPCMVDTAVGLALGGMIPFVNGFAALVSLRAMEQIRTCLCYARTNVKIASSYAGLSDFKDGPTHHATKDLAMMRVLPEMTVIVPADANETASWVPVIAEYDGPVYFRLSRASSLPVNPPGLNVKIGKSQVLRQGGDVAILAIGAMVGRSMLAAEVLAAENIQAQVINLSSLKPLDNDLVLQAAEQTGAIVTAEEHTILGGLGGAVAELLSENCPTPMVRVGLADTFARTSPDPESLMDAYGLGVGDIVTAVKRVLYKRQPVASL
jgi:transketolase